MMLRFFLIYKLNCDLNVFLLSDICLLNRPSYKVFNNFDILNRPFAPIYDQN